MRFGHRNGHGVDGFGAVLEGRWLCGIGIGQPVEGFAESGVSVVGDLPDDRTVTALDHGLGIDGFDGGFARVLASSDNDIAWQQGSERRFGRQGAARQGGVAGAKDHVVTQRRQRLRSRVLP